MLKKNIRIALPLIYKQKKLYNIENNREQDKR